MSQDQGPDRDLPAPEDPQRSAGQAAGGGWPGHGSDEREVDRDVSASERTQEVPVVAPDASSPRTTVLPEQDDVRRRSAPRRAAAAPSTAGGNGAPRPAGSRLDARPSARGARRRARLTLRRIDPWSVFTTSLLLSLFLGLVLIVAVLVLYGLLDAVGVLASVSDALGTIGIIDEGTQVVSAGQVLLGTIVIGAVDVVLLTVLATLYAFLYNLVASLTGGIEVTLSEGQ